MAVESVLQRLAHSRALLLNVEGVECCPGALPLAWGSTACYEETRAYRCARATAALYTDGV